MGDESLIDFSIFFEQDLSEELFGAKGTVDQDCMHGFNLANIEKIGMRGAYANRGLISSLVEEDVDPWTYSYVVVPLDILKDFNGPKLIEWELVSVLVGADAQPDLTALRSDLSSKFDQWIDTNIYCTTNDTANQRTAVDDS